MRFISTKLTSFARFCKILFKATKVWLSSTKTRETFRFNCRNVTLDLKLQSILEN